VTGPQALTTSEFPGYAADVLALAGALREPAPRPVEVPVAVPV
jgi:hypothetical protein